MKFSAALLSLAGLAAAAPVVERAAAPEVTIQSVVYGGSGCPQGSLKPQISPDGTQVFVNYNNKLFTATSYTGDISDTRKNCQLNLKLKYPAGWTYAIASTHTLGSVKLTASASAVLNVSYYTSGETNDVGSTFTFRGPLDKDFTAVDTIGILKYAECGPSSEGLNINSSIHVTNRGSITLDAAATAFVVALNWKTC